MSGNIFKNLPDKLDSELFEKLVSQEGLTIARIISTGNISPEGFWYDQNDNEFVIVLKGEGVIKFEDGSAVSLKPGDWDIIPAHKKHRVEWTDENEPTLWLVVHYS